MLRVSRVTSSASSAPHARLAPRTEGHPQMPLPPIESRLSSLEQRLASVGAKMDASTLHSIMKDSRNPVELERVERVLRGSVLGENRALWNSLMEAHGRVGQAAIADDIFKERQRDELGRVDAVACRVMIQAWGKALKPTKAAEYLRLLQKDAHKARIVASSTVTSTSSPGSDVVAWAMAIDAFARSAPHEAERLLDEMLSPATDPGVRPNEVCFNAVIAGYAARGLHIDAERMMNRMNVASGVRPDAYTYTAVMQSYARAKRPDGVERTWAAMLAAGVRPTAVSYHSLAQARATLCGAAAAEGALQEALADAGAQVSGEGSAAMFNVVLHAWAQEKRPDRVEEHLRKMLAHGVRPTPHTVSAVLGLWERLGQPAKAEAFVHWMAEAGAAPDTVCYNQVIAAYCRAGLIPDAERVLDSMKERKLSPTHASYVALYTAVRSSSQYRSRAPHYRALLKQARRKPISATNQRTETRNHT